MISNLSPETERAILQRLNYAAVFEGWFPGDDDGKCRHCGIRPMVARHLCERCAELRDRLLARHPDVQPPDLRPRKVHEPQPMRKLGAISRPEWMPHNSE